MFCKYTTPFSRTVMHHFAAKTPNRALFSIFAPWVWRLRNEPDLLIDLTLSAVHKTLGARVMTSKCIDSKVPQTVLEMGKREVAGVQKRRKTVKLACKILGLSLVLDWKEAFFLFPPFLPEMQISRLEFLRMLNVVSSCSPSLSRAEVKHAAANKLILLFQPWFAGCFNFKPFRCSRDKNICPPGPAEQRSAFTAVVYVGVVCFPPLSLIVNCCMASHSFQSHIVILVVYLCGFLSRLWEQRGGDPPHVTTKHHCLLFN